MEILIKLLLFVVLVVIGYFRGRVNQFNHLRELLKEEQEQRDILIFATRRPDTTQGMMDPVQVMGNAVVSADYFRYFTSGLRKFVGGNYTVYEELNERARRQAIVRMKQAAKAHGAQMIFNVCINTSRISHPRETGAPQVEIMAYGTAFVPASGSVQASHVHYCPPEVPGVTSPPYEMFNHPYPRAWLLIWIAAVVILMVAMLGSHWHYQGFPLISAWMLLPASLMVFMLHRGGKRAAMPTSKRWLMSSVSLPISVFLLHYLMVAAQVNLTEQHSVSIYEWRGQGTLHPVEPAEGPLLELTHKQRRDWKNQPMATRVHVDVRTGWLGDILWHSLGVQR